MTLRAARFAVLVSLVLVAGCAWPTLNPLKLRAIKAESIGLMQAWPTKDCVVVPNDKLPPVIASLDPDIVAISDRGVDITTTNYFDSGWGYFVPRLAKPAPNILFRHRRLGYGVYWFHPY